MLIENAKATAKDEEELEDKLQTIKDIFIKPPAAETAAGVKVPTWWHGEDEASEGIGSVFNVDSFIQHEAQRGGE